ncbi:hypothetical protein SynBIOSU31_03270 [Synechococcus sp. BIOS-U3-1]|uniref:hypothetical protein n=1 Tax=Synechococcus sp. BIOS-U3-1 TaxID=1400865 RepID=UPI0018611CE9|nr:hypothetical protein [Synechococcus sp. BIOS-U3-1]QNI60114.1 hypothetical protein SynBIOSU31_03270 [Synechococcus sp. BIOS-U3-1]|tara:strand:- start:2341 stop:3228 length:888 start_codon:yes stop_codon:yes gene_type:complete
MVVLAELRDRFPALDGLLMQLRGLLDPRRVLLVPEDEALHLAWRSQDGWEMSTMVLPPDLCRSGHPLNPEVLGESIADLLLERGFSLPQVEVELLLPLISCQWRLLEGTASAALTGDELRALQPELGWSLSLEDSYLDVQQQPQADVAVVVGIERQLLQAWADTLKEADLPLLRAEWLLTAGWRGLCDAHAGADEHLVWLVEQQGRWRLLLISNGCPEVDLSLQALKQPALRDEVLGLVEAWAPVGLPGWWVTAAPQWQGCWAAEHDSRQGPLRSDAELSLLDLALTASLGARDA